MKGLRLLLIFICISGFACADIKLTPETTVKMAMHLHTDYSYGCSYTAEEIVSRAKARGLDAVIFSDHDFIKVKYGVAPLKRLLRAGVELNSVFGRGVSEYYNELEMVQEKYPEMLVYPGVEASAFYFWERRNNTLVLNDWHKHLLIFGLNKEAMENLPVIENTRAWVFDSLLLWPFLILAAGIAFLFFMYLKKVGVAFIIIALGFLANNYPFTAPKYNQYEGYKGSAPYQELIDYTAKEGGFSVWAHPEAKNNLDFPLVGTMKGRWLNYGLALSTMPYPGEIVNTSGYSGFAVFEEGAKEIGSKGGLWDKVLYDFVTGKRKSPALAFGEVDYRVEGPGIALDSVFNVVNAKKGDKAGVLNALRNGDFYVVKKGRTTACLMLEEFSRNGFARLVMDDGRSENVSVSIIKDGLVWKMAEGKTPLEINFKVSPGAYFRLDAVTENGVRLLSNPLFIADKR